MAADSTGSAAASSGVGRSSNATADSYIGSLISLTSKSEIRYEGVLFNINTDESSIGLKNVRSFGTEGRKKDGPQIPPSDKVYEYILFRGSDIKDLQVKSSPPIQPAPPPAHINNDPAIIQQSHYPRPATAPTSLPTVGSGVSLSDVGSHNAQMGLPGSNFQSGMPLYQPGGSLGTWGGSPAPPPNPNGSGLAMPMYWPGYYGPSTGVPHLHQQSMFRPPHGLSMPPSVQQPMQFPNFNAPLPSGASNLPGSNLPTSNYPGSNLLTSNYPGSNLPTSNFPGSNLPTSNYPGSNLLTTNVPGSNLPVPNLATSLPDMLSLLPASTGSLNFASTSTPLTLPSTLTTVAPIPSDSISSLMPNKAPSSALPPTTLTATTPTLSPLTTSSPDLSAIVLPILSKPSGTSGPAMPYHATGSTSSAPIASSSVCTEAPTHALVMPGQLLQSGPPATVLSSLPVQAVHKDVEVVQVSSSSPPKPLIPVPAEAQPPILPLPAPSRPAYKPNGAPFHNRHGYRGRERGRGTGSSRPVAKFTEDFDFEAMNEKFNKDEVWGHLGKSKHSRDKEDGNVSDDDGSQDEYDDEDAKVDSKAVYNKDDFFDTLSCNTLGNDPQTGRPKFSEQMKIDTETFGEFSRYRGGRGGRGPPRGGRSRGSYNGRGGYGYGYGYTGRGRGRAMPSRAA